MNEHVGNDVAATVMLVVQAADLFDRLGVELRTGAPSVTCPRQDLVATKPPGLCNERRRVQKAEVHIQEAHPPGALLLKLQLAERWKATLLLFNGALMPPSPLIPLAHEAEGLWNARTSSLAAHVVGNQGLF